MATKNENMNSNKLIIRHLLPNIHHYLWIITVVAFLFVGISGVQAAEIRLDTHKAEINPGEQFLLDVILYSEESLNAIEGKLTYPLSLLSVKEIRDGDSVVNFWLERPKSYILDSQSYILFSGITPGGFSGANNKIFSVVFEAKNRRLDTEKVASIGLENIRALQNDGRGSQIKLGIRNATVLIKSGYNSAPEETLEDKDPPEDFSPTIEKDPNMFEGKYFLVFATQDKASGIQGYEVREGEWGQPVKVNSPHVLKYQTLDRKIFVRATDRAGNQRTVEVAPTSPVPWHENYQNWVIIALGAALAALATPAAKKLWTKKVKEHEMQG